MTKEQAYEFFASRFVEVDHNPTSKKSIAEDQRQIQEGLPWWENNRFKFIKAGDHLTEVNDSFEPVIPDGCTIKQIANFYDNKMVLIDPILWKQLTPFDQVALTAHEIIYAGLREMGHTNSVYARYLVGRLGSLVPLNGLSELISKVSTYYHCESLTSESSFPDHNYEFYVYPDNANGWNSTKAKFVYLNGNAVSFSDPISISGREFKYFGNEFFTSITPEEFNGQEIWLKIESTEKPLTFKLSSSATSNFDSAFISTVQCTKFTK